MRCSKCTSDNIFLMPESLRSNTTFDTILVDFICWQCFHMWEENYELIA